MRDLEKMKDKTVLAVDGRQLFFLFFGGSVAAALLFAAGVMVGRRLPLQDPGAGEEDPLAMLDQLGSEEEDLTFQKGLKGHPVPVPPAPAANPPAAPAAGEIPSAAPRPDAAPTAPPTPRPKNAPPPPSLPATGTVEDSGGGRFTLQLSSFQEKGEAAEFVKALSDKGYPAYVISAEVPGRGLWYRVRLGDYATHGEALEAKADFERKQRIIAYVLRK
jgi:DedD protein